MAFSLLAMACNGVQGLGAGVLSVGRGMVHHFLRMKVCQLVDLILQDHTSSFLINIRVSLILNSKKKYLSSAEQNRWGRLQGTAGKYLVASAAFRFFSLSHKEVISGGPSQARTTWYAYEWGCRRSILEGLW